MLTNHISYHKIVFPDFPVFIVTLYGFFERQESFIPAGNKKQFISQKPKILHPRRKITSLTDSGITAEPTWFELLPAKLRGMVSPASDTVTSHAGIVV